MALEIKHRDREGIEIIDLVGRLTFGEEDLALRDEISKAMIAGRMRLVLNLSKVTQIDSTGLGALVLAMAKLRQAGGGLVLTSLQPEHMDVLVIAKMERAFKVFEHEPDAINSFFPERHVPHFDLREFLTAWRRKYSHKDQSIAL